MKKLIIFMAIFSSSQLFGAKAGGGAFEKINSQCIDSKITDVIVYPNQAEVTRKVKVKVNKGGKAWFCLRSLPINLKPESLKIQFPKKEGMNDNIVLEKVYRLIQLKQIIQEKMDLLESLLGKKLAIDQDLRLKYQTMNFLTGLRFRPQLGSQNKAPLTFQASDRRIISSLDAISKQVTSIRSAIQKQKDKLGVFEEDIRALRVDLNQQGQVNKQSWSYDLFFTVESKPGTYSAEVKYLVPNVSWKPLYDVRADIDTRNSKVNLRLITLAELKQNTLEDWEGVRTEFVSLEPFPLFLPSRDRWVFQESREEVEEDRDEGFFGGVLSQSESLNSRVAPAMEMEKASMDLVNAMPMKKSKRKRRRKMEAKKEIVHASSQGFMNDDFVGGRSAPQSSAPNAKAPMPSYNFNSKPNNSDLFALGSIKGLYSSYGQMKNRFDNASKQYSKRRDIISRTRKNFGNMKQNSQLAKRAKGRKITYESQIPINLERSDSPLRVPLDSKPLKAELTYFSIPHKDSNVYMRALVHNSTKKPILGGSAQIFINGKLTTKTTLSSISEHGTFFVDLGMDKNVEVERVVDKESVDEGMVFKKHKTKVDIKIRISNRHSFPITIKIGDRQPISSHKEIEIKNIALSDKGSLAKKTGLISWTLKMAAKTNRELKFTYSVTHPENFIVSELN